MAKLRRCMERGMHLGGSRVGALCCANFDLVLAAVNRCCVQAPVLRHSMSKQPLHAVTLAMVADFDRRTMVGSLRLSYELAWLMCFCSCHELEDWLQAGGIAGSSL